MRKLVATVAHPGANMNTWFTNPVFTWIGKRSYGIYIYQYPVMVFFESKVKNIAAHPWLYGLIEIAIILAISEISYRYIEIPLKNFDYSQTLIKVKQVFKRDKS
ncbi:acetyltransferase, partial [Lactobacillus salivarius]|nr:acetyltransferase [Ligilactobacillus salivarius]